MLTITTSSQSENNPIPKHVAIICDGNRRWAKAHALQAVQGHNQAAKHVFEPLLAEAMRQKIEYVTFWVFSTENWARPKHEVEALMQLFRTELPKFSPKCHEHQIRINHIGNLSAFPQDIQDSILKIENETKLYNNLTVIFGMNYGGRDEIIRAINQLRLSESTQTEISPEIFEKYLDTKNIPDPDIIIRTSGEQRLSGFMPWQSTYSELFFLEATFPELTPTLFAQVINDFSHRKRRFGK